MRGGVGQWTVGACLTDGCGRCVWHTQEALGSEADLVGPVDDAHGDEALAGLEEAAAPDDAGTVCVFGDPTGR